MDGWMDGLYRILSYFETLPLTITADLHKVALVFQCCLPLNTALHSLCQIQLKSNVLNLDFKLFQHEHPCIYSCHSIISYRQNFKGLLLLQ